MNLQLKGILLLLLLLISIDETYSTDIPLVLKISPVKGENFSARINNIDFIEEALIEGFKSNGYKVHTKLKDFQNQNLAETEPVFADVFLYQYLERHNGVPLEGELNIALLMRNNTGVLFEIEKSDYPGLNKQKTLKRITSHLIEAIPSSELIENKQSLTSFNHLRINKMKTKRLFSHIDIGTYTTNFEVSFKFDEETNIAFLYDESISEYLKHVINHKGFRGKILNKEIVFHIEINEIGLTLLKKIELPVELSDREIEKLKNMIDAIPIWLNKAKERRSAKIYITDF